MGNATKTNRNWIVELSDEGTAWRQWGQSPFASAENAIAFVEREREHAARRPHLRIEKVIRVRNRETDEVAKEWPRS